MFSELRETMCDAKCETLKLSTRYQIDKYINSESNKQAQETNRTFAVAIWDLQSDVLTFLVTDVYKILHTCPNLNVVWHCLQCSLEPCVLPPQHFSFPLKTSLVPEIDRLL